MKCIYKSGSNKAFLLYDTTEMTTSEFYLMIKFMEYVTNITVSLDRLAISKKVLLQNESWYIVKNIILATSPLVDLYNVSSC